MYNRAHFLFFTRKRQHLSNSLSISSISLLPFLSFSRYSLMNCFIISSQNTFARHPEAPRITTARSLAESVESSHCASILGISTSSGCIWHGLGLGARIVSFVQQQSLEKTTSSPCTSKRPSTLLLLSNSRLCPLHLLLVWQLSPALCPCTFPSSLCEKETAVQDPSKVLQLPFRRLYHKLANHLTLETLPPRCFLLILPLFLRKAPSFSSVQRHLYSSTISFLYVSVCKSLRRCLSVEKTKSAR